MLVVIRATLHSNEPFYMPQRLNSVMNQNNSSSPFPSQPPRRPSRTVGSVPPPVNAPGSGSYYAPGSPASAAPPPSPQRRGSPRLNGVLLGLALFLLLLLIGLGVTALGYVAVARTLPSADRLPELTAFGQNTRIYARDGSLLQEPLAPDDPEAGLRTHVSINEISPYLLAAVVATEDANFYRHRGIDPIALGRAIFRALQSQGPVVGTSTISQQLAKLVFLSSERTMTRKIKEAILSAEITRRFSKDIILETYLNEIYYGNLAYGIGAASQLYFNKPAIDLTLAEAALLAGLPQSPASYDPLQNPEAAKARQAAVLRLMVEAEAITPAEADAAWAEPLTYYGLGLENTRLERAPHFVMTVRSDIEQRYGPELLYRGGLQIYTSLDPRLQSEAEAQVRQGVAELQGRRVSNGALVALNPRSGEILAMVGSVDFNDVEISGQVNVALSPRQPGSTIKPFTYLATFERAEGWWTPATLIDDVRTEFDDGPGRPPYVPVNYDGRDHGRISVRAALARSYNIPAVKALQLVGVDALLRVAERFGMTTLTRPGHPPYGLALTLGGGEVTLLEMTSAYGALANGGLYTPPNPILCVLDADGIALERAEGADLPDACRNAPLASQPTTRAAEAQRAATPQHSYLITDILSDNDARIAAFGANSWLQLDRPAAVKTGTTNDVRDIWTVGYTPQLVTGVWVGNADGTAMDDSLSGVAGAGPIWNRFMRAALADTPAQAFSRPTGIIEMEICTSTGAPPDASCPPDQRRMELFVADQAPAPGTPSAPTATALPQAVYLSAPGNGATLTTITTIRGSASLADFDYYLVEYGESFTPGAWGVVAGPITQPVLDGDLAQWDVSALSDGPYVVRVVAVDRQGRRVESAAVPVMVALPTAEPSPTETATETPTPEPLETETPVPLETATPAPDPTPLLPAVVAQILTPLEGSTVSGVTEVLGLATGTAFASYSLQLAADGNWVAAIPGEPVVTNQGLGFLGSWDTTLWPNGTVSLRLVVNGVNGESTISQVQVVIAN